MISAAPVNFRNANGEWQPIDNRLRASSAVGYAHENTANSYDLLLPADVGARPVRVQVDGAWVSYALDGARGSGSVAGNAKTYQGVLPATDLRLSAHADGVKEDLILRTARAPESFSYTLETSTGISARANEDGGVDFIDAAGNATEPSGASDFGTELRRQCVEHGTQLGMPVASSQEQSYLESRWALAATTSGNPPQITFLSMAARLFAPLAER